MNETRPRDWFYILSYTMISIVTLGFLYFVTEWFLPETSADLIPKNDALSARFMSSPRWDNKGQDSRENASPDLSEEKIRLTLNQEKKIGKSKIVYRGLDGNSTLKIDVVILDLDPYAYYPYRIYTDEAKKGFRLAGQNFKLISARKSAIQIWHFKK
jgi:hypothetical protein